jgi:hypothetical protein
MRSNVNEVDGLGIDVKESELPDRRVLPIRRGSALTVAVLGITIAAAVCLISLGASAGRPSADSRTTFLAFARCMRSHGISDFPDPTSDGSLKVTAQVGSNSDLNPNSPAYQTANQACRSLLPGGPNPAQTAQDVAAGVKLAACMRSHGFASFPDPNSQDVFNLNGFDTSSAQYQSAFNTCQTQTNAHGGTFRQNGPGS